MLWQASNRNAGTVPNPKALLTRSSIRVAAMPMLSLD
jgi:hypothetical protein